MFGQTGITICHIPVNFTAIHCVILRFEGPTYREGLVCEHLSEARIIRGQYLRKTARIHGPSPRM